MNLNKLENIVNADATIAKELFVNNEYIWDAIKKIKDVIKKVLARLLEENEEDYIKNIDENGEIVLIHKEAKVMPTSCILGPSIICKGAEIRHCAFIRGNVIVGENAVIGNSSEIKSSIIFNNAQIPHYNYIGDTIAGERAHFGAQSLTSNLKSDKTNIFITIKENNDVRKFDTGLKKFGAIVGDNVEIGCGTVLNPGTIIGKNTRIYPLQSIRGIIDENRVVKTIDNQVELKIKK